MVNSKGRVVLNEGTGFKTGLGNDANEEQIFVATRLVSTGR